MRKIKRHTILKNKRIFVSYKHHKKRSKPFMKQLKNMSKLDINKIKGYLGTGCLVIPNIYIDMEWRPDPYSIDQNNQVLAWLKVGSAKLILKPIDSCDLNAMSYKTILGLYENHYDIHGLIDLGLAVDYNLIKKQFDI